MILGLIVRRGVLFPKMGWRVQVKGSQLLNGDVSTINKAKSETIMLLRGQRLKNQVYMLDLFGHFLDPCFKIRVVSVCENELH